MLNDNTMLDDNHEQIRILLTDTLSLLLRSGIKFKQELNIEGLVGVHIDKQDAFFVHISHKFEGSGRGTTLDNLHPHSGSSSPEWFVKDKNGKGSTPKKQIPNGDASKESLQNKPASKESLQNEPASKESLQNEPTSKEPLQNEPASKEPIENEPASNDSSVENGPASKVPVQNGSASKESIQNGCTSKEPIKNASASKEPIPSGPVSKEPIQNGHEREISELEQYQNSQALLRHVKLEPPDTYNDVKPTLLPLGSGDARTPDDFIYPMALFTENNKKRKRSRSPKSQALSDFYNRPTWCDIDLAQSFDSDHHLDQDGEERLTVDNDHKPYIIQPGVIDWTNAILDSRDSITSYQSNYPSSYTNDDTNSSWSQALAHSEDKIFGILSLSDQNKHAQSPSSKSLRKFPKRLVYNKRPDFARPYICKICGRPNRRPSDLVKHMRVHTGERPYDCPVCNVGFKSTSPLYCHLRRRHGWQMGQRLIFEGDRVKSSVNTQVHDRDNNTEVPVFTIT